MEPGELIRPPEAPVFQPTIEEFKDPVAYISKIRPVVVNTGICKIKPPPVSNSICSVVLCSFVTRYRLIIEVFV